MRADPIFLFDPEIVIPSSDSAANLAFWDRMLAAADDPEPRLGPATLSALLEMAATPPQVLTLAEGDFWKIVSQFMARGFSSSPEERAVCEAHVRRDYRPVLGDGGNPERLITDLKASGNSGYLALRTVRECWKEVVDECESCIEGRIAKLFGAQLDEPAGRAVVWRTMFLENNPNDVRMIEKFASRMFPSIEFSSVAWNHLGTLSGDPSEVIKGLVSHLGVLNDYGAEIWAGEVTTIGRQRSLRGYGVTASPESPQTRRNSSARRTREFEFRAGVFSCEWHTKLRPNVNRVYFSIVDGAVRVGSIVDHLPV